MNHSRLLVIGLDGFDPGVAEQLLALGKLPHLARLQSSAQRFQIEHGVEKYTGLAWEQFSSGLGPLESSRWSATWLDTHKYLAHQPTTRLRPFADNLNANCAVFDVPYFDLSATRRSRGMVAWGSHDPGVPVQSNPPALCDEIMARFGPYPATRYIYGHVWQNPEKAADMAAELVAATELRRKVTRWLFSERLSDWDLAMTVISEYHSATEALWHGWDPTHPLHFQPSSKAARNGLIGVYEAADRMLGEMIDSFPDVRILAFSPHGMGRNLSDVPAMLLLPELLYRWSTGKVAFTPDPAWAADGSGSDDLADMSGWSSIVSSHLNLTLSFVERLRQRRAASSVKLDWMPASQYRRAWPLMNAYALPAYYDGRIRINLKGREKRGRVPLSRYGETIETVRRLLEECRDLLTGDPLDIAMETRANGDPCKRDPSDADLIIRFNHDYYGFYHPRLGAIGPAPCRRPGGHTGGPGAGWFWSRSGPGGELGHFRTTDIPQAVCWLMGQNRAISALGAALALEH